MWPILVAPPAFPVVVETYPVLLALAIASGAVLCWRLLRLRTAATPGRVVGVIVVLTITGLAGARLHFLLANRDRVPADWTALLRVWDGGFHAGGAVIGVLLASLVVTRAARMSLGELADCVAPAAALAMAIHRVACLLRGCCLGALCSHAWCVPYPRRSFAFLLHVHTGVAPSTATASAPVHPLPLYYVFLALAVLVLAFWRYPRRRFPGEVALLSLALYAAGTWYLERFRAVTDHTVYVGTWPQLTLAGALLTGLAAILLVVAEARVWWAGRAARG